MAASARALPSAARVLPLRPLRALRSPRRHPTTLRSVPTREASGAPAPAAPPPSSAPPAGAPPATPPGAGAPPAAPPAPPVPESGERVRPAVEPLAVLLGQILAIVRAHPTPAANQNDAAAVVWRMLDAITSLIVHHIAKPAFPLGFHSYKHETGLVMSLLLDTQPDAAKGAPEAPERQGEAAAAEAAPKGEEREEEAPAPVLTPTHACLVFALASAMGELGDIIDTIQRAQELGKSTVSAESVNFYVGMTVKPLDTLSYLLRTMSESISGLPGGNSLTAHALRLGQLDGYTAAVCAPDLRDQHIEEALDAFQGRAEALDGYDSTRPRSR